MKASLTKLSVLCSKIRVFSCYIAKEPQKAERYGQCSRLTECLIKTNALVVLGASWRNFAIFCSKDGSLGCLLDSMKITNIDKFAKYICFRQKVYK